MTPFLALELTSLIIDSAINAIDHHQPEEASENLRRASEILKKSIVEHDVLLGLRKSTD